MQNRHRSMLRCCFESDSEVNRSCLTQRKHSDTFRMKIVMASGTGMQRKCRDPKSQDEKSNGEFSCLSYCLNTKCLHQCDNCLSRVMYWCSYSWLYWLIILLQEWLERFGCFLTGTVDSVWNITLNRGSRLSLLAFPPRSLSAFTHQSNERNKKIGKKKITDYYFGILVTQLLYQNKFKVRECELQKARGSRDHGASDSKTWTMKLNSCKFQQSLYCH